MATTVIIPARNENKTIGRIVATFQKHETTTGRVFVAIDADTEDNTARSAIGAGGYAIRTGKTGKGQVVFQALTALRQMPGVLTTRIILCDGDYTGLATDHISRILTPKHGMVIGVPDYPEIEIPPEVRKAWPHVSGFRCIPTALIPETAHGYLLETQLNLVSARLGVKVSQVSMPGLKSPFQWPLAPKREEERARDRKWGKEHGIL